MDILGGQRGVQQGGRPGERLTPLVVVAGRVPVIGSLLDSSMTASHPMELTEPREVLKERVGPVDLRQRRGGMQLAHVVDVSAEHPLLQGLRRQHVVRHEQELLAVPC